MMIKISAYAGTLVKYQTIPATTAKTRATLSDCVIPSNPYLKDSTKIIPQNSDDIQEYIEPYHAHP